MSLILRNKLCKNTIGFARILTDFLNESHTALSCCRLIGRPSSVIFKLNELAHHVEECAEAEKETEDLPEVKTLQNSH